MSNCNRIHAINAVAGRQTPACQKAESASLDHFGEDVFNVTAIRKYLPKTVAKKLLATIQEGKPLDASIADDVAHGMKEWALERGATHFTHWFQPLTGSTAEKHDSFLDLNEDHEAIMSFSAKNLIMGEPDASSFPSGGLRCTFEARGYTAWDPTSPAFIKRHSNGATLCIPTIFCSYTGEVLDKKTPLLRSIQALSRSVSRLMKCFGKPFQHVEVTLGPEQEYFLVDRNFYMYRPDLVQAGRTVFGSPPPRHQQLEDHYFGAIRSRVLAFMTEVEHELWKLGIPAKTRHNEVAPAQFEVAPIFEELNLAVDHNMQMMEILKKVAVRHGMVCLLHEKPFAGVNGSGKHNNWSITYGKENLLDPGNNPCQNAIFLTVLSAIIRAVDLHADLLRTTTASVGNDHRLGANEAPPAIISIFLGDQLADIVEQVETGAVTGAKSLDAMRVGVDALPSLSRDATDRNRTSPFAFTGNKFEFRACGSSQSCADVNTVLNTIVAESLDYISEKLEKTGILSGDAEFHDELQKLLQEIITKHKRIIFNGDNYSSNWIQEAQRRGLPNLRHTMDALKPLLEEKNQTLFARYGIFSKSELDSRYEVFMEEYHRKIRIEGGIALEMARSMIMPVVVEQYRQLVETIHVARKGDFKTGISTLNVCAENLGEKLDQLKVRCVELEAALGKLHEDILEAMKNLREVVDALELMVDDSRWPLPKYREMLFIY
ncbi:MAG: glutamine synthetase III [Planctomycetia bacterium]|nr:glutamine synthetase III [Planctomycetia bacterium]